MFEPLPARSTCRRLSTTCSPAGGTRRSSPGPWDCHGLPVELAVEKELGFTGKGDIEAFGVAEFNARCRESVLRHVAEFERLTEWMGYWVDTAAAYRTMDPKYIDSVWWSLKTIFDRGLLVEDHRVTPYCPRCGTGLSQPGAGRASPSSSESAGTGPVSDHEVAQGYLTVTDPSVYVRFPVTGGPCARAPGRPSARRPPCRRRARSPVAAPRQSADAPRPAGGRRLNTRASTWWAPGLPFAVGGPS